MEKKNNVLIVDDDPMKLMELFHILQTDYNIITATDGTSALERVNESLPDLVLLDIVMPDMNGFHVLAELKKSDKTKAIPVIFMTASDEEDKERDGLAIGAVDFIRKPFDAVIVKLRVRYQIQIINLQRDLDELQSAKLNLAVKASKIGLWEMEVMQDDPLNPANAFIWSDELRYMLGYSDETDFPNILSSWSDLLHPNDKKRALDAFEKHLFDVTGETPYDIEYQLLKKNGEYSYYHASGETIRDKNGNPQRAVGTLLDVTESKNLLLEVENARDTMEKMLESIETQILVTDIETDTIIFVNHTMRKNFNLADNVKGKKCWELFQYGFSRRCDFCLKNEPDFLAGKAIVRKECNTITGEYYRIIGRMIDWTDGSKVYLQQGDEITEIEAARSAAEAANRTKSVFLANMSHEIRTPMNAIIGMADLLAHEQLNERQSEYVNDITVSAKSLLEIINDILDFSKIESGKLELSPIDFDLRALIDNIESMFVYVAHNKGLEFKLQCGENLPDCLYGDDIRLRQILLNICGNAVKFTNTGYVELKIDSLNHSLVFKVKDTGIGIRKEDMGTLFNAFEQVDKSKNRGLVGTGLGLALSKSFVDMMGGEIKVESEYGRGTVFTFSIPIVEGNAENIRKGEIGEGGQMFSAPDAKVLVVDDNEFNLKVAGGLLRLIGIEAEMVNSGFRAIELVKQNDYDIVFMDHMMPDMDGIETVREIRKLGGKYAELTIVALTANAVKGARDMFLSNSFNDFIEKPINTDELHEVVKRYLPPEKVRIEANPNGRQARLSKEEELRRKAMITFAKENHDIMQKITDSLNSGDTKAAHLIAHTLKSSAGYLGKKELQEAAFSLEQSLQAAAGYTTEQIDILEKELKKALFDFGSMLKEAESKKSDAVQVSNEELISLLSKIEPLLKKGDFGAGSFVEELQGIAGMEELAERIDNYDFDGALQMLKSILAKASK